MSEMDSRMMDILAKVRERAKDPELLEMMERDKKSGFNYGDMDHPLARLMILSKPDKYLCESIPVGPTMGYGPMKEIASYAKSYFDSIPMGRPGLSVLEIFAGNCSASLVMYNNGVKHLVKKWVATDVKTYDRVKKEVLPPSMIFKNQNPVDSVKEYGHGSNILVMIAPPPYSAMLNHSDYYATTDFIKQKHNKGEPRYIMIVGGLGTIDGSRGMYRYMMEHPNLVLVQRKDSKIEYEEVGYVRELFIFRVLQY
jgi:hypothetical protein